MGVLCWDPNLGPIELYFTADIVFFWVENSFLTFEYVFYPYPVYSVGILILVRLSTTLPPNMVFLGGEFIFAIHWHL